MNRCSMEPQGSTSARSEVLQTCEIRQYCFSWLACWCRVPILRNRRPGWLWKLRHRRCHLPSMLSGERPPLYRLLRKNSRRRVRLAKRTFLLLKTVRSESAQH
nr:putative integron gene cassette protein [uncultured bacterium]